MNRVTKIVLFIALAAASIAAEQLCCGIPSCIPGQTCGPGGK